MTRHGSVGDWLAWLEATGLGVAMRQWRWLYPIVEIVHIAGIVVLVGAAAMFDLRLLGVSPRLPVSAMAAHLLPWARAALAIVVANPAFRLKLLLIAAALTNAAAFHRWPFRSVSRWDVGARSPLTARFAAIASLSLWSGVIACGRLLAYF